MSLGMSRLEINLRRLIAKCELMMKEKSSSDDSRIEKYLESIEEMLIQLEKSDKKPDRESFLEYEKRVDKLKSYFIKSEKDFENKNMNTPQLTDHYEQLKTEKYKTMRDELLGMHQEDNITSTNDTDVLLKYHSTMQEKIADEMLELTRNLKEQTKLAGNIIRKDTEVVKKSAKISEDNFSKLKVESEKLKEHSKRAWKCWMWVMIIIVMTIFINMVLFMKVMKKKAYA